MSFFDICSCGSCHIVVSKRSWKNSEVLFTLWHVVLQSIKWTSRFSILINFKLIFILITRIFPYLKIWLKSWSQMVRSLKGSFYLFGRRVSLLASPFTLLALYFTICNFPLWSHGMNSSVFRDVNFSTGNLLFQMACFFWVFLHCISENLKLDNPPPPQHTSPQSGCIPSFCDRKKDVCQNLFLGIYCKIFLGGNALDTQ